MTTNRGPMSEIDALRQENRPFSPPAAFRKGAHISDGAVYTAAATNPEAFWESQANELLWYKKWNTVLEWTPPHSKWFVGGKLNISANCVDRHITSARRNKAALIWE